MVKNASLKRPMLLLSVMIAANMCFAAQVRETAASEKALKTSEAEMQLHETDPGAQDESAVIRSPEPDRDVVIKRIRMIRIWRLTSELNLDEDTARQLFPMLNGFEERKARLMSEGHRIQQRLAEEMAKEAQDESRIKTLIQEYKNNRLRKIDLYREECQKVEEVLTFHQFAKYILFWERFNHELQSIFREALGHSMSPPSQPSRVKGIQAPKTQPFPLDPRDAR